VRPWLRAYIAEHEGWWRDARGVTGGAMDEEREWDDVLAAGDTKIADLALDEEGVPIGLIMAEVRPDRHLGVPTVVIQWIAVAPEARGRGLSAPLLEHALRWGAGRGATSAEVFVTAANAPAVRAYERAGFAAVDVRMIRPLN
jgi:GNAT superfamily N-acetyltransferase